MIVTSLEAWVFKLPLRLESVPSWCTVLGNERLCLPRYQPNLARVEDLRMTKEDEIMVFLHERVFDPILKSPEAPQSLKQGVRLTIARMWERDAAGMIEFYYSAIVGTDRSIAFAAQLRKAGFIRFEEVMGDFRERFTDEWLKK
ncbi:MAG: hypothetical protein ACLPT4_15575 [Verrucomicrobiia bacterium]